MEIDDDAIIRRISSPVPDENNASETRKARFRAALAALETDPSKQEQIDQISMESGITAEQPSRYSREASRPAASEYTGTSARRTGDRVRMRSAHGSENHFSASARTIGHERNQPHRRRQATATLADGTPANDALASDALAFTRRVLSDAYEQLRAQGIDRTTLESSFATAFASTGVSAAALRLPGRDDREQDALRLAPAGPEPVPDLPGADDLRPDPGGADTVAEFLDCLRNYRIWAGSPSYRVMSRNCQRRFAPSTIWAALRGDSLPSFEMVLAIVTACGGPRIHQSEFATAWRRLAIPRQEGDQAFS